MSAIIPTVATTKVTTVTASVSDVGGTITPVYVFDGTTMNAVMADWSPLGLPFSVGAKSIALTVDGTARNIVCRSSTINRIQNTAADVKNFRWRLQGNAGNASVQMINPAGVGTTETSLLEGLPGLMRATNNAEVKSIVADLESNEAAGLRYIAFNGTTGFWHGPIWDLKLTDNSPMQDTDVLDQNGVRILTIPSFDMSSGGTVTVELIYSDGVMLDGSVPVLTGVAGVITAGANVANIAVDGEAYAGAVIPDGQHVTVAFDVSTGTVDTAGAMTAGSIANLVLDNSTDFVHYKINEGAGTEILAYDAAGGLLPLLDGTVTPDAAWSNIPNNSRYYPMRDGIPGAGVLQDVIGGHDATIQNYDENSWDYEPTQTITTASNAGTIGWLKDNYGDISRQQVQGYQRRMTSVRVDTVGDMAYIEWDIENLYPDITGIFLYWNGIGLLLNRTTPTSGLFSVAIPPTPETSWIAADGIERGISITAVKG